jgi:hypothetical protein
MKSKTIPFSATVDLCGIPYKIEIIPWDEEKAQKFKEDRGISKNTIACVDNNERVIYMEGGRKDIGYILLHELIHAAVESIVDDPNTQACKKYYGESWVKPFSRILWSMMVSMGMIDSKFL